MDDRSNYLKIDEAARLLGVSTRWVYRRIWSGELPASKVGGLYFIDRQDLQALMEHKRSGKTADLIETPASAVLLKCGYCFRLLTSDELVGEVCEFEACERLVCKYCLEQGVRHCAAHAPSRDQKFSEAQQLYQQGDIPVLVKSSSARLMELNFLNRIQARLARFTSLIHPLSGELLNIPDWDALLETKDERAEVMRMLDKVLLDSETEARQPLNASLCYRIPQQKKQKGPPLEITIQVISRLPLMLRDGFDTRPLSAEDLTPLLLRHAEEAQRQQVFRMVVWASMTGWDASARQVVQGEPGAALGTGRAAFMHRMALYYLFDLHKGELFYNLLDDRARPYAELFAPVLLAEEIGEAAAALEKRLLVYESLPLDEAVQILPYRRETLQQAFKRLAATGRYALMEAPGLGTTIVREKHAI